MNKKILMLFLLLFPAIQVVLGQQTAAKWDKWNDLTGIWEGDGKGEPGNGNGTFSFQPDLGRNILVRKSHTEFPAADGQNARTHDDLMVIYPDFTGEVNKAIYFDNEGHVINYKVTYNGNDIVLTSEVIPNVPVFRLTYEILDKETVNIKFAMASPQKPSEFTTYIEGKSRKVR